jgi:hypothetical protein
VTPTSVVEHPPETVFDQLAQRYPLGRGDLLGLDQECIGNVDGCLHIANHIITPAG